MINVLLAKLVKSGKTDLFHYERNRYCKAIFAEKKINKTWKGKMKTLYLYIIVFTATLILVYVKRTTYQNVLYTKPEASKMKANIVTFITSTFTERNGTLHLQGYFKDSSLRGITVLDITNFTNLARIYEQKDSNSLFNNEQTKSKQSYRKSGLKSELKSRLQWDQEFNSFLNRTELLKTKATQKVSGCAGFDPYISNDNREATLIDEKQFVDWELFQQNRVVHDINCQLLFDNDTEERITAMKLLKKPFKEVLPSLYINKTKNCQKYIKETGYITSPLTDEEEDFPIAYSILVFKGIQQVEMLLRAIYRPQNVYCIHCDTKADEDFKTAIHSIVSCFENVFVSSRSFTVEWGTMGVLLPDIVCMGDLWKHKKWKYFINLTGQEFPLRTNYELVKILQAFDGANSIESTIKRANGGRWKGLPKPPHNILPVKGSVHIAASRGYVDYILHNQVAKDFFNWTKGVDVPDELFFSTLNHNPHLQVPGSYQGEPETDCYIKPFLTRFKNWGNHIYNWPCHGTRVRLICVFGIGDLPLLASRPEMFANKFYLHYQPFAYQCMDELIFNRTRDEYFGALKFDTSKYKSLKFIKNTI